MVINIKPEYSGILFHLFPTYALVKEISAPSDFILFRDVKSQLELLKLESYPNSIIVSRVLFEEMWSEDVLIKKVLEFRRVNFKSRKSTLHEVENLKGIEFYQALMEFLTTGEVPLSEDATIELFDAVGSMKFIEVYLRLADKIPEPKLQASILTFLSKIAAGNNSSLFYQKKCNLLQAKVKRNMESAVRFYNNSARTSLEFVKFITLLTC